MLQLPVVKVPEHEQVEVMACTGPGAMVGPLQSITPKQGLGLGREPSWAPATHLRDGRRSWVVDRVQEAGRETVGKIVVFENTFLCHVRGPEALIAELAERLDSAPG